MQTITNNNQLYLSGGGNEQQSFPLDKFFFESLPNDGHFLYVPIALRGHEHYTGAGEWMKKVLELHGRNDIRFDIADDVSAGALKDLKQYDAVYIGGGNTWSLMKEINESGFGNQLTTYFKGGGKIYGGSAGAIILGKNIDTHNDEKIDGFTAKAGFGFLGNYSIACHFTANQEERFKSWAKENNSPIFCLTEENGLVVKNNSAESVGTTPVRIYFPDGTQQEMQAGNPFSL